jgi:hypothetical protein
MYSYEDRLQAVRLYIKLGLRVGPTIRRLPDEDVRRLQLEQDSLKKANGPIQNVSMASAS